MKSINEYNILKDGWIHYDSKICSVACSLGYIEQFSPIDRRINELVSSFFNQWQFVVITYDKLYKLFSDLNEKSDHSENVIGSPYLLESIERENDFKNYSYLLIVSMKTYLDLFSCLVDIIQNQIIREEHELPDINTFGRRSVDNISEVLGEFERLRNNNIYPWISLLKEVRNKIIHRGYNLKPNFGFKKSHDLMVQVYKGTDFYTNVINIEIGKLFNDFMTDMPLIESVVSTILLEKVELLNKKLTLEVSFKYDGQISQYCFRELEAT